ncbi:MAG: DUF2179 domain-containing protein [Bacteroidetes bacterium]|nr:MAG: DUF2179 domain-containing protein [Bacteroidota bacterium]
MDLGVLGTVLLIVCARVADVSLGTMRTMFIIQGRRGAAFGIGFVESLIWVYVVSSVIKNLTQPIYAVSFALGFALGNYIGITLEGWMAPGKQVVRIFSRNAHAIAERLREQQFVVSEFAATGLQGPIDMLFLQTDRRKVPAVLRIVTSLDPDSFYIVDDVRMTSAKPRSGPRAFTPTGWRAVFKKK